LQMFARNGLVEPVDAEHMYDAAIESKSCQLTLFGKYYRQLVLQKRI
ncbi:MAG: caspase family protein, partial [Bacteroidota bacterium]